MTGLHLLSDGTYGDGTYFFDGHVACGSDVKITVAEERTLRCELHGFLASAKSVVQAYAAFVDSQVLTVYASFWSVHAPFLGTVTVIKQLGGKAGKPYTLFCLKQK